MTLHLGDCLDVLRTMPDASVDAIVTDPPYGLSFMGKRWDYDVPSEDIWRECLRVLKPGGHLLAFAGTRTQHRMAVRIEDAGFEIRDMIAWVYGSGFPKSLNVANAVDEKRKPDTRHDLLLDEAKFCAWMREHSGLNTETVRRVTGSARFMTGEVEIVNTATKEKPRMGRRAMVPTAEAWARLRNHMAQQPPEWIEALVKDPPEPPDETPGEAWTKGKGRGTVGGNEWAGWGTALKPALEPVTVARKPLAGTVAENVMAHGTGAINIDGCRIHADDAQGGEYTVKRFKPGATLQAEGGTWKGDGADYVGTMKPGRWPANLIHDGSDEVVGLFPQSKDGVAGKRNAQNGDVMKTGLGARDEEWGGYGGGGSAARFFYCAKASKRDRDEGLEVFEAKRGTVGNKWTDQDYRRGDDAPSVDRRNHHPTVKPTDLMRYLCRLVTPPGGVVLDPFMGSGSTGKAAVLEGFRFIGIERDPEYHAIASARIAAATPPLFAAAE